MVQPTRPAVFIRRVRVEDAQTMQGFLRGLSVPSRRNRFHGGVSGDSPAMVALLVGADGVRHAAWVACIWGADGEEIIGEAGWAIVAAARGSAELALSVLDGWQGSGVAGRLMSALVKGARDAGLRHLYGDVLSGNRRMLAFMRKHGLEAGFDEPPERGMERLSCRLPSAPSRAATEKSRA
jgi:acetyltransferase